VARRRYLIEHDVATAPTHFPHNEAGLQSALQTAENHCGAELYTYVPGEPMAKATCRRVEVWELDGHGQKIELLHVRQDGILAGPRGRLSALAARVACRPERAIFSV
jgi:hypothetical protein